MTTAAPSARYRDGSDPDDLRAIIANVLLAAAVPIVLFVAPVLVGQMIRQLQFSVASAGYIISIELGTMCLATIPAYLSLGRVGMRQVVAVALSLVIAGDTVSIWATSFAQLATIRAITGLGGGSIMALCMKGIGLTSNKDRNFGYWLIGQLASGVVGLLVLPPLFQVAGLWAFYLVMAVILLAILPLTRFLPADSGPGIRSSAGLLDIFGGSATGVVSIIGVLLFYVAISGVWTYIERLGHAAHVQPGMIGATLAGATVMGVAGAGAASFLASRFPRFVLIAAGFAILALSILLLLEGPRAARYVLAACMFKFAWTFVIPFMFASISAADPSGRMIVSTNFVVGGGLSIGPAIGARLLTLGASYDALMACMLAIAAASGVGMLLVCMRDRDERVRLVAQG